MALLAGIALTALGVALLNRMLAGWVRPTKGAHGSKGRIIEIDEYEILGDDGDQSDGYKVTIQDGNN